MQTQTHTPLGIETVVMTSERVTFLQDVDFKWLMAGHGWWIDTDRFHKDSSYAAHLLKLASESDTLVLRESAASLQPQHDNPRFLS